MRPVRADFATRLPILQWAAVMIAILGFTIAAFQVHLGLRYRERALVAESEAALLRDSIAGRGSPATASKVADPPHLQDALAIVRIASNDFGKVLTSLETVQVPNIKVSSIEIVTAEAAARVDVEFTETEALLRYVDGLNAGLPESAERWKVTRAQLPTGTTVGMATIVPPSDIGRAEQAAPQQARR